MLGDGIPPAQFLEVKDDPQYEGQIVEGGQLHTGYVTMNVNTKPFDDVQRAAGGEHGDQQGSHRPHHQQPRGAGEPAAAALDARLRSRTTRATPTIRRRRRSCSPRPALADGFSTELYVYNTDPNPRIAQAIQQDLAAIGINAELKSLAQANVIAAGGDGSAPMIWSGGMGWIADFPDPSNFYGPILGCGGAVQGGWNWSWYCNEELDKQAAEADAITDPAKAEEREQAVGRDLRQAHGGRALGAGLQRAALHHALASAWRAMTRSTSIRCTSRSHYDAASVN